MTPKLFWKTYDFEPLVLWANLQYSHGAITPTGLREEDLSLVQQWCERNKCGIRSNFGMFKFKSQKEITMFLLVWG